MEDHLHADATGGDLPRRSLWLGNPGLHRWFNVYMGVSWVIGVPPNHTFLDEICPFFLAFNLGIPPFQDTSNITMVFPMHHVVHISGHAAKVHEIWCLAKSIPDANHGAGIFTYIETPYLWPSFVGKYSSTMEYLGMCSFFFYRLSRFPIEIHGMTRLHLWIPEDLKIWGIWSLDHGATWA